MNITNLGRVQGGSIFYSTEVSNNSPSKSSLSPANIAPLVGDSILFFNGDLRNITAVGSNTVTCGPVIMTIAGGNFAEVSLDTEEVTIEPNCYYNLGPRANTNFTLNMVEGNVGICNEYMFDLFLDENECTITTDSAIQWQEADGVTNENNVLTLEGKYTYQFDIVNNLGLISRFANKKLAFPTNFILSGTVLSWDAVENAEAYTVVLNEQSVYITATSIDLSAYITATGSYTITVTANSSYYTDSTSTYTYVISETLATPTNLVMSDAGSLSWDTVTNATSYTVTCVELATTSSVTTNLCDVTTAFTLTSGTTYTFTVQAIGDGTVYLNSATSTTVSYTAA